MGDDDALDCVVSISPNHISRRPLSDDYVDDDDDEDDDDDDDEGEEEIEELNMELGCPFCSEDYDALGLCVHLDDQHLLETKSGICPICATNLGRNMMSHLVIQHQSTLKSLRRLRKKKHRASQSSSIISLLRKKLQDEHLQSLSKKSSSAVDSSNLVSDPLLLSFISNPPHRHEPEDVLHNSATEPSLSASSSNERTLERDIEAHPVSHKNTREKFQRCEFVHALLFSAIFSDSL